MAKKNARDQEEIKGNVNMSPMIDCCFLLLIFFVVNAIQITVSKDPSVRMPSAITCNDMKDAKGCIVINIFKDFDKMDSGAQEKFRKNYKGKAGVIWGVSDNTKNVGYTEDEGNLLTEYVTKEKERFKAKKMEDKDIKIYLRGDKDAPWERTCKAIRCAAAAGVSNLVFGTLPAK